MKCLFVAPGMAFGGAERVCAILAREWAVSGVETCILVTKTEAEAMYPLPENTLLVSCKKEVQGAKIKQLALIRAIRKWCTAWKPDVVISFYNDLCALTALAVRGLNIPLLYSERNDPGRTNRRFMDRVYRKITELFADKVVFQTQGARKCYSGFVQKKSQVILNPLDASAFPVHDFGKERKEIVSVGRLEPQKNQKLLITAFAKLAKRHPEYRLVIYGTGSLQKALEQQIREAGLDGCVLLAGTRKNVQDAIRDAALFVMSSDYEGLPNALMEAMALGLPCLATDCTPGGARELIRHGQNGLLVPCGDVNALAAAMEKMITDREMAAILGKNAIELREKADSQRIANEWLAFIQQE